MADLRKTDVVYVTTYTYARN